MSLALLTLTLHQLGASPESDRFSRPLPPLGPCLEPRGRLLPGPPAAALAFCSVSRTAASGVLLTPVLVSRGHRSRLAQPVASNDTHGFGDQTKISVTGRKSRRLQGCAASRGSRGGPAALLCPAAPAAFLGGWPPLQSSEPASRVAFVFSLAVFSCGRVCLCLPRIGTLMMP